MDADRWYVTSAIPYVNADPHLGHALEFVQADTLARWRRLRGDEVRALWGTDDNAAKNVQAARQAGVDVQEFVDTHAARFAGLREVLDLGFDDFIRTSRDPRHRPAVERLWRACADTGDLYRGRYEGRYCTGCEQFYEPGDLVDGRCPEHDAVPEHVVEDNWFFRLSRYADVVGDAIRSQRLRVAPEHRRNEILAFLDGQVRDISVSRPAERSGGWGIPVPGDPDQVVYVWFDALSNYISALGYATDHDDYQRWWVNSDRRVHVIGKGILRFHAAYWPAFLLSAGLPLPTDILVHEYVTVDGAKISKSHGTSADPIGLAERFSPDALRWWLLRDVNPTVDTDFRTTRLVERHDQDLANGLGNLLNRILGLLRRAGYSTVPETELPETRGGPLRDAEPVLKRVDVAVERLDFRTATSALWELVDTTNAYINRIRPWDLADDPAASDELATVLAELLAACRLVARHLPPFLPRASERVLDACRAGASTSNGETLFVRLDPARTHHP